MTTPDTTFDRETVTKFLKFIGEESMPDGCEMAIVLFHDRFKKLEERFGSFLGENILMNLLRHPDILEQMDSCDMSSIQIHFSHMADACNKGKGSLERKVVPEDIFVTYLRVQKIH